MNNIYISDAFRNMIVEKIFSDEIVTIMFHQLADVGSPGTTGFRPDGRSIPGSLGTSRGVVNLRPDDWEVGDTGIIQNKNPINVGVGTSGGGPIRIYYFSLWRQNGDYLGYRALARNVRLRQNKFFRLDKKVVRIKF